MINDRKIEENNISTIYPPYLLQPTSTIETVRVLMPNKVIRSKITNPGIPTIPENMFLGRVSDGDLVWTPNANPHILVNGLPGTGKTVFLQNLAEQCRIHNWAIFVIEGEPVSPDLWMPERSFESNDDVVSAVSMLDEMLRIMRYRYGVMEEEGVNNYADSKIDLTPGLIVIDALDKLLEKKEDRFLSSVENPYAQHISALISSITRLGRAAGIYVAASTTKSLDEFFDNETLLNFGTRVNTGVYSSDKERNELNKKNDDSRVDVNLGKAWINIFGKGEEIQLYGPVG